MKLKVVPRTKKVKKDAKRLRRDNQVPGVIYSKQRQGELIVIAGNALQSILRAIAPGKLPVTVFELEDGVSVRKAIIKEIQYNIVTYAPQHVDFEELLEADDSCRLRVKVPVVCRGMTECPGVKLGGALRVVRRHVPVSCSAKDIPSEFVVDVCRLGMRQSICLRDVALPEGVMPLIGTNEALVVVSKR